MHQAKTLYGKSDCIGYYLKMQRLKNVLPEIKGRLLDIACGDNSLAQSATNGIGVDIADYGADLVVDNYYSLPYNDNAFDTITILSSLNYFEQPARVLEEIFRLVKSDGILIITNTNLFIMKIWHLFRERWAHKPGLSQQQIGRMMNEAGFALVKKRRFNLGLSCTYIYKKKANA